MATYDSNTNLDLVRRYFPSITVHTHEQIAAHIAPNEYGCWPWDGCIAKQGYGKVWLEPTEYGYYSSVNVHRYMYDILVGPIPYGYDVHHRCQVKACWCPFHLEAVTPLEHKARHR